MKLDKKKEITEDLHGRLSKSKLAILTDYKGLDVTTLNTLRRKLREADAEYQVVKNTLLSRASESTGVAAIRDAFKGPSAIALSYADPVAVAKILTDFAKENDKFEIKMGVMDGKSLSPDAVRALSKLPSREVLLGQLLSVMNGVPTSLVRALANVPGRLVNVLQAIRDKKEEA